MIVNLTADLKQGNLTKSHLNNYIFFFNLLRKYIVSFPNAEESGGVGGDTSMICGRKRT